MQGANRRQGEGGPLQGGLRLLQVEGTPARAHRPAEWPLSDRPGAAIRIRGGSGATAGTPWLADLDADLLPDYLDAVVETDDAAPLAWLVDGVGDLEPAREFECRIGRTCVVGARGAEPRAIRSGSVDSSSFAALPAEAGWRRECAIRRPFDVAVRQQAQPGVVEVAEAVSDAVYLLDQEVGRFGGFVGDPVGVEVGQQLAAPRVGGVGQLFELGGTGIGALQEPGV